MKKLICFLLVGMTVILGGCFSVQVKKAPEASETLNVNATAQATENETKTTQNDIDDSKPVIAFTFDDGPSANTTRLLDVLKKYNVKATFFVVGNRIAGNEGVLKRMVEEGHDIGSHSWDHTNLQTADKKTVKEEMTKTRDEIFDITGYKSKFLRPPYGAWSDSVKAVAKKEKISIINWNIDTEDWKTKDKKKISKLIMKEARDGAIVLSHDLYDATVKAMDNVIPKLLKEGYQIVTVTQLLESHDGEIQPGMVYYNRWQTPQ